MKDSLINSIHHLIYHNIYCSDPLSERWSSIAANGYEKRIIGFKAEVEYKQILRDKGLSTLDGGWMLSRQSNAKYFNDSIYFTVSNDEPDKYSLLYSHLEKIGFEKMLFIKYDAKEISSEDILNIGVEVLHPYYECFLFENGSFVKKNSGLNNLGELSSFFTKKENRYVASYNLNELAPTFAHNNLSQYSEDCLLDILADRFIFDGVLGFGSIKGIPGDIDLVVKNQNRFSLLEIKEKDMAKTIKGFGMDTSRRDDLLKVSEDSGLPMYYVVKEVNNQKERVFKRWWFIEINDFVEATKNSKEFEGGTGMSTARDSDNPTVVAPIEFFKKNS